MPVILREGVNGCVSACVSMWWWGEVYFLTHLHFTTSEPYDITLVFIFQTKRNAMSSSHGHKHN